MSKVIGIVGSRRRNSEPDYVACSEAFLDIFEDGDTLVSGGCSKGGDRFAEIIAADLGLSITIHFPDWKLGKSAGFVRNTKIAEDCDVLIAVVSSDRTGGTEDTIKKARKLNKKIVLVKP